MFDPLFQYVLSWSGVIVIVAASLLRHDRRKRSLDFETALYFTVFMVVGLASLSFIYQHTPATIDLALLRADKALGFDTLKFVVVCYRHHAVVWILAAVYVALAPAIGLAWVQDQSRTLRAAFLFSGCACFVFYFIFPAVGPNHFDWNALAPLPFSARNCVPSMHFGWALLIALNAKSTRWVWWSYAALMALATLALGQHYLVDLLASIPFVAASQYAVRLTLRREFAFLSRSA